MTDEEHQEPKTARFASGIQKWLLIGVAVAGLLTGGATGVATVRFAFDWGISCKSEAFAECTNGDDQQDSPTQPPQISPDDETPDEPSQPDLPSQTPTAKSPIPTVPLTVVDGEQVFRPGTGEVYVVKIVGDERYKRHFITDRVRDTYGHLKGVDPTRISQEEFDSFAVSCLVRFEEDYYFFNAREDDDQATKHLITDGWRGLAATGISAAAIFVIHDLEINNSAFVPGADISAATAARKPCGES